MVDSIVIMKTAAELFRVKSRDMLLRANALELNIGKIKVVGQMD